MKLIILTAVLAVCGAAKLEKRFILPGSARIGGSAHIGGSGHIGGSAHIGGSGAGGGLFGRGLISDAPSGGYTNDAEGVVVDAVAPGTRASGVEPSGLGGPRTAYGSVNSKVGEAAFKVGGAAVKAPLFGLGAAEDGASRVGFGVGSAAVKGGNTGGFGIGVSPGAASISTDGSGFGSAALKGGNAGSFGIGVSPGTASISTEGSGLGSAAVKGGNAGSFGIGISPGAGSISTDGSGLGSAALKGGNAGSFGIGVSPGTASISTDGSGFGSAALKGGNTGSFGIGVSPGAGSISTDGSGLGSAALKGGNAGSFGIGVSPGAGSISTDGSGLGSAALKGGNAGSFGIGVSPGVGSVSTDGSGFGSAAIKGGNAGSFGIGISPGAGSISTDGSASVKGGNAGSFGIGILPGAGSISTDGSAAVKGGNAGSFGIGTSPGAGSISTDGLGFGSAAIKGGNAGSFGIGVSPGAGSVSTDGSGFGSAALKGGNAGSLGTGVTSGAGSISTGGSGFGSAAVKGGNVGGLGIGLTSGIDSVHNGHEDDKAYALEFANSFGLKKHTIGTDSGLSVGVKGVSGSTAGKGNAGSFGIGVSPGAGSISTDGSGLGSAAAKGGNAGSFGIGVSPEAGSISTDGSGLSSAALKGGNAGSFGIGVSPGVGSVSTDGSGFGSVAVKGGNAGSFGIGVSPGAGSISTDGSGLGSAALKGGNAGSFGIGVSPGVGLVSTDGSGFGSAAVKGGNAGGFGIGVSPGAGSISTDGLGFGSAALKGGNAGSFGINVSPGGGSISTDGLGFGSAALKGGNAGSFGIGVSPGAGSISTDGSGLGSAALKGGNAGSFGIGVSPGASSISTASSAAVKGGNVGGLGIDSVNTEYEDDKAYALKFANSFGLKKYSYGFETDNGISVGAKGVSTDGIKSNGEYSYKGTDGKDYSVKYTADKNGYRPVGSHLPTPPPIPGEILESLKQNAKDEAAGIVDDGTYNAQKYKDEGDSSNNGAAVSIGGSFASQGIKSNAASQSTGSLTGSTGVQGSYGHTQGFGAQTFENKNIGFGLSQGKQENSGQGLFGIKPQLGFQTTSSQQSVFEKTERFGIQADKNVKSNGSGSKASATASIGNQGPTGVPTLGGSFKGSSNDNSAYSSATVTGSGSASAFANIDATQGTQGSKSGSNSFNVASQPYLKLVDSRPKLSSQPSKDVSLSTSSAEVSTLGGSLQSNFPAQTSINTDSNSATVGSSLSSVSGQYQGSTSTHHNDITQASISSFPSLLPSLSSNFGIPSSSHSQKSTYDQKVSVTGDTQSSVQQGTVYEYSKPTTSLSSEGHVSQVNSETETSQTLFGSQGSLKPSQTQYNQQPFDSSQAGNNNQQTGVSSQQYQGEIYEYNKPAVYLTFTKDGVTPDTGSSFSQAQYGSTSQSSFGQKQQTTGTLSQISTPFLNKPSQTQDSQKPFDSSQAGNNNQQTGVSSQQYQGEIYEYNKPAVYLTFTKDGVTPDTGSSFSQTQYGSTSQSSFGQKQQTTGALSQTSTAFGQKPVGDSQTSTYETTQFSSSYGSLPSQKPQSTLGSFVLSSGSSKGESAQFGVKPIGFSQTTGNSFSQTQLGSTSVSQSGQKPQISTVFGQKPVGVSQTSYTSGSSSSLLFNKKSQSGQSSSFSSNDASKGQSGLSTQFSVKPFGSTLNTGSSVPQTQFGSTSGFKLGEQSQTTGTLSQSTTFGQKPVGVTQTSTTSEKTQFDTSSSSGASKGQYGLTTQFGVKPFGSTLNTGSSFSQSKFGSTFGSQNDQNSQVGVGTISATFPHVTPISQYDKKPFGTQSTTFGSFQQSQHYAGQKPQTTGTVSQTSTTFGQKPIGISQSSATYDKTKFGSLFSEKSQTGQGSSFSSGDTTKGQSGLTSQFGIKPFGSSSNTGSSISQTQFSSTFGSQKDKSQLGVGTVSTTFPHVTPISQYDKKPFGTQSATFGSFQQSQHYAGQKPQTSGTGSQTSTTSTSEKTQFGSSSQFSSTSESQKDHKSQLGIGTVSTTFPHVTPISQYGNKPFGAQSTFGSFQQSQYYTGQKPQTTFDQKQGLSQTSTTPEKTQFGSSSSSLFSEKLQSAQGSSFSSSGSSKDQSGPITQFGIKPFGATLNTGSSSGSLFNEKSQAGQSSSFSSIDASKGQSGLTTQFGVKPTLSTGYGFSQTQFDTASGIQNDKKSQSGFGTISAVTPQVVPISQYNKKPLGFQSSQNYFQQSQYSGSTGSQTGQNGQSDGSYTQFTIVGQEPTGTSHTDSGIHTQLGSSGDEKLQFTQGGSHLSKEQTELVNRLFFINKIKSRFGSVPSTGSSSTQTHFDSSLSSQYDKKPIGSQSSQDLLQGSFGGIQNNQVSKYQTSQFSTSGVQPIGSLLSQTIEQQKTQTSSGTGGQKQFGSFESSFQQTGSQKPSVIQISQPFEFRIPNLQNNNLYTVSSSSNSYPYSEIHQEQNIQGVSEPIKVVSGTKTSFSKVEKKVSFQGPGELFAGIREPPKFDIKTGYHY